LEILLARLRKLMGEGRVGSPQLLDSHAPEAFRITNFNPGQSSSPCIDVKPSPTPALRMLRPPRAVAIELRGGAPVAMRYEGARHIVQAASGPWRSSGAWWTHPAWCREEWDVALENVSQNTPVADAGRCLRLAHDPAAGGWYVIGMYD
jgi:protein ImuB